MSDECLGIDLGGTKIEAIALIDGEIRVWESLAILDHVADTRPDLAIWLSGDLV